MSGSIAAIAAYDGTGTQGYGTTDKTLPGVKSVFWNENDTDKYYVNGCSFSEVSSNKGAITSPETVVFTFDNDIDAINDLVLTIGAENIKSATSPSSPLPPWFMAGFIERIEICIGNQVISTIFTTQIKQLLISDKYLNLSVQGSGNASQIGSGSNGGVYTNIRLPIFNLINSKTNCSYLMACANNQVLQVKVYPQFLTQSDYNTNFLSSSAITIATADVTVAAGGSITSNGHGLVTGTAVTYNASGALAIAGLADETTYFVIRVDANTFKLASTLANANAGTAVPLTGQGNNAQTFTLDWGDSHWNINVGADNKFTFNLYANKYSMTNSERDFLRSQVIPKRTNVTQSATISNPQTVPGYPNLSTSIPITIICDHFNINAEKLYITSIGEYGKIPLFNVELFLNSTSYCGTIQSSVSEISMGPTYSQYISTIAETAVAGRTVSTDAESCKIAEIYFAKNSKEYNTDQNYVPLSKYDSIRIVLTPLSSSTMTTFTRFLDYLTVVVEGKCTALYQDGAVVFNNY